MSQSIKAKATTAKFPPLEQEVRTHIGTRQAAFYTIRNPETLQHWANTGSGPITPIRIVGRLAWPVAEIRSLLGVNV